MTTYVKVQANKINFRINAPKQRRGDVASFTVADRIRVTTGGDTRVTSNGGTRVIDTIDIYPLKIQANKQRFSIRAPKVEKS